MRFILFFIYFIIFIIIIILFFLLLTEGHLSFEILWQVVKDGVGVIASSKGVDLALCMAADIPQIKAAVCINGSLGSLGGKIKLKDGHVIDELPFNTGKSVVKYSNY